MIGPLTSIVCKRPFAPSLDDKADACGDDYYHLLRPCVSATYHIPIKYDYFYLLSPLEPLHTSASYAVFSFHPACIVWITIKSLHWLSICCCGRNSDAIQIRHCASNSATKL